MPMGIKGLKNGLLKPVSAAPLALFRILFGALMAFSLLRFWLNGWIEKLYLQPPFHFTYWGFDGCSPWVIPPTYSLW